MPRDYNLRWRLALPVVLISLPLIFLLIVAVYFLRQDKLLVDTEARETAAELGRMLMTEFTAQALRFPPAATYTNANPWPATELFFQRMVLARSDSPTVDSVWRSPPSQNGRLEPALN